MELSERKKNILKSIIDSYIKYGEPVGSKYLVSSAGFNVSSATIRNEMSELENLGFLEQPHTSAGRVPSALGYRTYIENLMERYMLGVEEINVLNELLTFKISEVSKIMEQASRVISELTNYTTISVLSPGGVRIKRFEAIAVDERSFLLAMICADGSIRSKHIKTSEPLSTDELSRLLVALNKNLSNLTMDGVTLPIILRLEEEMGAYKSIVSPVLRVIYDMLDSDKDEKVTVSGMSKLLSYPEFSDIEKAKSVLSLFEAHKELVSTVLDAAPDKTYILISGESEDDGIGPPDSSFVFRPVSSGGKTVGAVGVIGPKRMDYKKVIASLEYLASGINDELNK